MTDFVYTPVIYRELSDEDKVMIQELCKQIKGEKGVSVEPEQFTAHAQSYYVATSRGEINMDVMFHRVTPDGSLTAEVLTRMTWKHLGEMAPAEVPAFVAAFIAEAKAKATCKAK